ncbi:hypothetical protein [Embleya sp. NPDC020630]|uniref:hypothetical protein n=1 Tax=Embleya sp. NPDC020630 TaxID=3363979 RepID=UPI003788EA50
MVVTELLGVRQVEYTLAVARIEPPADVPQPVSAHDRAAEPEIAARRNHPG